MMTAKLVQETVITEMKADYETYPLDSIANYNK